jgi:hypothetical protein
MTSGIVSNRDFSALAATATITKAHARVRASLSLSDILVFLIYPKDLTGISSSGRLFELIAFSRKPDVTFSEADVTFSEADVTFSEKIPTPFSLRNPTPAASR